MGVGLESAGDVGTASAANFDVLVPHMTCLVSRSPHRGASSRTGAATRPICVPEGSLWGTLYPIPDAGQMAGGRQATQSPYGETNLRDGSAPPTNWHVSDTTKAANLSAEPSRCLIPTGPTARRRKSYGGSDEGVRLMSNRMMDLRE